MSPAENMVGPQPKLVLVPLARHRKPFHRYAIDTIGARREFISPRQVIACARGQNTHIRMTSQMFGNVSCMQLGATIDVGSVSLHDDRDLHGFTGLEPPARVLAPARAGGHSSRARCKFSS